MTKAETDEVLNAIIAFDTQASRCFLAADKLVQRDLPKAKRLVALGFQAAEQSSSKRKIWNDMHSALTAKRNAIAERAKLEAFADRAMTGLDRQIDPTRIARDVF